MIKRFNNYFVMVNSSLTKNWLVDNLKELWRPTLPFSTEKILLWSVISGIFGALISVLYKTTLKYIILVIWNIIPSFLIRHGAYNKIPSWNYTWIVCTIIGCITGLLMKYTPRKPGNLKLLLEGLHLQGTFSSIHFLPMFFISLVSISAGTSTGPEVSVLILMGAVSNYFNNFDKLPRAQKRTLMLCWMGSGISSFFGLPMGGALFVLEVPHRMGIQYFEALSPVMVSSLIGVLVSKAVQLDEFAGGIYTYPPVPPVKTIDMLVAVLLGVIGAALAFGFTFLAKTAKKLVEKAGITSKGMLVYPIITMTVGGFLFGWIGVLYPQTLFWSEYEMDVLLTRGESPLPHTIIPSIMHISIPYTALTFLGIALFKALAILICAVIGFPGGILFPVYFVGLAFGVVLSDYVSFVHPTVSMLGLMAAFQVAILRTAWATNVILLMLSAPIMVTTTLQTDIVGLFLIMTISSYTALFLTRKYHYYPNSMQRSRNDFRNDDEYDRRMSVRAMKKDAQAHFEQLRTTPSEIGNISEDESTSYADDETPFLSGRYSTNSNNSR